MLWKTSHCGNYLVSECGNLQNKTSGFILTPTLMKNGYYRYGSIGSAHRLVYEAFVGKIPEGLTVNHLDGVKTNNHISNLEVCTQAENIRHAVDNGLMKPVYGENHGASKLTESDVRQIYGLIKLGYNNEQIADKFGVYSGHISSLRSGIRWKRLFIECGMRNIKSFGNMKYPLPRCIYIYEKCLISKESQDILGKELGIDASQVNRIRNGKTWKRFREYYNEFC